MTNERPFRVIYRWRVDQGHEEAFQRRWEQVTDDYKAQYGALGSCLHRATNGDFIGYASWPSREHWSRMMDAEADNAGSQTVQQVHEPIELDVMVDLTVY